MTKLVHPAADAVAVLMITIFWLSTVLSELFGTEAAVIVVKRAVPLGFSVLIPALAVAGGSGFALAKGRRGGLIGTKIKRMPIIAANGILVLVPAALFLAYKAKHAEMDGIFYTVQVLELLAGALNITLLSLNMRDGLKLGRGRPGHRST